MQLLVTEAPFTPTALSCYSTQVIFEEFNFAACGKLPAASLSAYHSSVTGSMQQQQQQPECVLVVDSGFSFTHVIPYYRGKAVREAIKRINVGGKLLTNFLKETVSYRQWNMMDEFQLMNDAKEALCYVSLDFAAEMAKLRPGGGPNRRLLRHLQQHPEDNIRRNFVLPDFQTTMKGYVQEIAPLKRPQGSDQQQHEQQVRNSEKEKVTEETRSHIASLCIFQVLAMEVERFVVPEVLMRPSDLGLRQAGLAEAIHQAVQDCDVGLQGALYGNIVLTGGNIRLPGLSTRLEQDLRTLVPQYYPVSITTPSNPVDYAWEGGSRIVASQQAQQLFVTKQTYDEYGADACHARFFDAQW